MSDTEEPRSRVVALRYEQSSPPHEAGVPRVVAKGTGWVAERILALAHDHGVPVHEDRDLVALLSACDIGEDITPEMYAAVAEVLAWLYRCNTSLGDGTASPARV